MIVSTPIITTLAIGSDRRTVEKGDNEPVIPNSLLINIPSMHQTLIANLGTEVQRFSCLNIVETTRTNQAALDTTVMTLAAGLWEIYLSMTNAFNWAHVVGGGAGEVEISVTTMGNDLTLLSEFAAIGTKGSFSRLYRFLFLNTAVIHHFIALTGVGQTTDANATVNAVKLL